MEKILEMENISKSFSGIRVLNNVSFDLYPGEVHALVGENGAGKSTLMKILMGVYQSEGGSIKINGAPASIHNPSQALALGISMVHQELSPVPEMSVAENIFIGREEGRFGIVNLSRQEQLTSEILNDFGLNISAKKKMGSLSVSEMQMVEIAKSISCNAKIIIMDEPTSAITEAEVRKLFEVIKCLCEQKIGIIYISHKMDELYEIADRVTVLRDGCFVDTLPIAKLDRRDLIRMMVGREITDVYPVANNKPGEVVLSVKNLTRTGEFQDVSFDLHAGERLGIAGLMGAGRTELVMTVFGARKPKSGEIWLKGKKVNVGNPKQAIRLKMALVTEDRKRFGLNLLASTGNNIVAVIEKNLTRLGMFNNRKANSVSDEMISKLNIRVKSRNQAVSSLSGGNQQKVVLAKWLAEDIDIIIFDEPTRGIDVGAKAEIYKIINTLAGQGKAIIFISSEMPELIGMTDRIIVLHEGNLAGELKKEEISQERIMALSANVM
ncbi:MAG TPA: sugar ABC transporter ATP-binding protein [Anaerovoracaceae bacterium]|nr:sugar ABC transporter ATP-binding protein [Anaerovoracaceae bacterium]